MSLLNVKSLSVCLAHKPVLHHVSFGLNRGEHACIIGPNGAGKTSLLKAIACELALTTGRVNWRGANLQSLSHKMRAKNIAVLPQFNPLNFPFTVTEVIRLGRIPFASRSQTNRNIINKLLKELALDALQHQQYTTLSGGEKQRVQLARVLAQSYGETDTFDGHNKLLLLDEPTSALDLQHQSVLATLLKRLQKQGLTIVSVVHDINLACQMADTLLGLKAGNLIIQGAPKAVITPHNIKTLFDIDTHIMTHPNTKTPFVIL